MYPKIKLNRDRKTLSGRYPVVFCLTEKRRRALIYTGIHVYEQEFDKKRSKIDYVKGISKSRKALSEANRKITQIQNIILDTINEYTRHQKVINLQELAQECRRRIKGDTLYALFEKVIDEKRKNGHFGSAKAYESTYRKIQALTNKTDIQLCKITTDYITDLYKNCSTSGISCNTTSFYMRNFKAVLNRRQTSDKAIPIQKLFQYTVIRKVKTTKRALSVQDMKLLLKFNPAGNKRYIQALEIFWLCFILQGTSIADLCFIPKEALCADYICYKRHKTSTRINVALNQVSRRLLYRYKSQNPYSQYLFRFMDQYDTPTMIYGAYRNMLKRINSTLKQIGIEIGLNIPLTSYVARHTWATQAKSVGTPAELISEAMGHTSQHTTSIYLKNFDQNIIDNVNNKVIAPYQNQLLRFLQTY